MNGFEGGCLLLFWLIVGVVFGVPLLAIMVTMVFTGGGLGIFLVGMVVFIFGLGVYLARRAQ